MLTLKQHRCCDKKAALVFHSQRQQLGFRLHHVEAVRAMLTPSTDTAGTIPMATR